MLIHDGGERCLLGRGAIWPAGRYSTLAGFVEPGESLESAVVREVYEEVGVVVDDVRYVGSQPWPFPSSLMLGFIAHADGASIVRPDKVEMAEAGWFTRAEVARAADWTDAMTVADGGLAEDGDGVLRAIPPRLSISRYLIDTWLNGSATQ
jgi:NAD+ diphosphatase